MSVTVTVPLYGGELILLRSPESFSEETGEFEDYSGHRGLVHFAHKEDFTPLYYVGVFDNTLITLVHELGHACLMIVANAGFNAHDANGEPFCYLLDYLVSQLKSSVDNN
jgi:hypothetical protein